MRLFLLKLEDINDINAVTEKVLVAHSTDCLVIMTQKVTELFFFYLSTLVYDEYSKSCNVWQKILSNVQNWCPPSHFPKPWSWARLESLLGRFWPMYLILIPLPKARAAQVLLAALLVMPEQCFLIQIFWICCCARLNTGVYPSQLQIPSSGKTSLVELYTLTQLPSCVSDWY